MGTLSINSTGANGAPIVFMPYGWGDVLPLQFLSCKGWAGTDGNRIEWETNNDLAGHFEVERSKGGNYFETIAVVPYKINDGSTVKYQFVDKDVIDEVQFYRIKVIEQGNTGSYSQIISIRNNISGVEMKRQKFNEASSQIRLNVRMLPAGVYIIKLTDHKAGRYYNTMFTK